MLEWLRTARGVARSFGIYYGDRTRAEAMQRLYAQFIKPGDLVFDVGAHVGDRVRAFRRLGARVVAVEPQPALATSLQVLYGRDRDVVIEPVAVGRAVGSVTMHVNVANPTVSTASQEFVAAAAGSPGWHAQRWTKTLAVPATTLDLLIAKHGKPAFAKIDIEGYEAEALAALSQPVAALSFEFTTLQRDVAVAALGRCVALGYARFNAALGESQRFEFASFIDAATIGAWLAALPDEANSGDVYAWLD
ncbi:MAG TPA: FkbM family methyltransferase [Xanthobacteraceae bacterium]|nr:FkbM family methyltransferase [Xanthobacteraceae bacterium]